MSSYVTRADLQVDSALADFIENEAMPGTGVDAGAFWSGVAAMVADIMPRNNAALEMREDLQGKIDDWHRENGPVAADPEVYEAFLKQIGYLVEEPGDFEVDPGKLDPEIATICGPQLVVPVSNARYALNAANARWGSLYDALYGTDAISREGKV